MAGEVETFFSRLRPEAERLSQLIGAGANAVPVFLAQWANESAYGGSLPGFSWTGHNNYSGLTDGGPPNFRKFGSTEEHTRAQAAALQDPDYAPNYAPFLQAARENQPPTLLARLLGLSGWDFDSYSGDSGMPGQILIDIMERDNLQPAPSVSQQALPGVTGFPPAFSPILQQEGRAPQKGAASSAEAKQAEEKQTLTAATTGFLGTLKQTVFSWDWWKRALWLLILLLLALLLIYFSLRGMTNPQAASQGEGD